MELLKKNAFVITVDVAEKKNSISFNGEQTKNGNLSFGNNILEKCFRAINRHCNFFLLKEI